MAASPQTGVLPKRIGTHRKAASAGKIEGFIILQNGWLDRETHRPQVQWIKQHLDWLFGTHTARTERD